MYCHISTVKCKTCLLTIIFFIGVTFAIVIPKAAQQLRINADTTVFNKSLQYEIYQNTTSNVLLQELISNSTTILKELQDAADDLETKTEVNLHNVRKKLNEEDLYEYVTEKSNLSERSFVFIPASKYKIPFLNPLSRPQKLVESAYDKTFISNMDSVHNEIGDFEIRYAGNNEKDPDSLLKGSFDNTKSTRKESLLDEPFFKPIHGSPLKKEMDTMTKKVKAANGIINMQYKSLNKDLLMNIEKQFPRFEGDKQKDSIKDESVKMFKFDTQHKKPHDYHHNNGIFKIVDNNVELKDYIAKQQIEDHIDMNATGVNINDGNIMGDRYDYVELIKPALLRPESKKKSVGLKSSLYDTFKIDLPYQPSHYKHDHLSPYNHFIMDPYGSGQLNNQKATGKLKSQPYDKYSSQNPSNNLIKSISEQNNLNNVRTDVNSNDKHTFKSSIFDYNKTSSSRNHNNNRKDKPFIDLKAQTFKPKTYFGDNSRSPINNMKPELPAIKLDEDSRLNSISNTFHSSKPYFQAKVFGHDRFSLVGKTQNNLKKAIVDSKPYLKNNRLSDYSFLHNPYRSNIVPYKMTNQLQDQKMLKNSNHEEENSVQIQTESYKPIKHIEFYPEDEEPDFHNSLLAKKYQEMRDLGKQIKADSASHETSGKSEMNVRHHVNNTQDYMHRKETHQQKVAKAGCVYPDCEIQEHHHKYSKVKPQKEKCNCESKIIRSAPKSDISNSGEISPVFINASTEFEVK